MSEPSTHRSILDAFKSEQTRLEARQRFTDRYYALILAWCRKKGLQDDAEDVAHDAMLQLFEKLETHKHDPQKGRFRAWLNTVVRNKISDHQRRAIRSQQVLEQLEAEDLTQDLASDLSQLYLEDLRNVMNRVRPDVERYWEAFHRTEILGRKPQEVAQELQITIASVYQARHRVKEAIKAEFQKHLHNA